MGQYCSGKISFIATKQPKQIIGTFDWFDRIAQFQRKEGRENIFTPSHPVEGVHGEQFQWSTETYFGRYPLVCARKK